MVAENLGPRHPVLGRTALIGAQGVVAACVTLSAAVIAAALAVVFAATMAVVVVMTGAVLAVWALAFRLTRRRPVVRAARGPVTLEARKVGHAWITYGWDQAGR